MNALHTLLLGVGTMATLLWLTVAIASLRPDPGARARARALLASTRRRGRP